MVTIIITVNRCQIKCHIKTAMKLRELTRIKNPNAFYLRLNGKVPPGWDGYNYYITEAGYFAIGLLPIVVNLLKKEFRLDIEFIDNRPTVPEILLKRDLKNGFSLRGYQYDAVECALTNRLDNQLDFGVTTIFAATNAGKTIIASGIHNCIPGSKTVLLLNQADLYRDGIPEAINFLGESEVGWMQGKNLKWANFMIIMVPTLRTKLANPLIANKLRSYNTMIFDECDTALAPTNKKIINSFTGCYRRIGMSGSVGTHKDKNKNRRLEELFGSVVYTIKNTTLQDMGVSAKLQVTILTGNRRDLEGMTYNDEYDKGIIVNKARNSTIIERVREKLQEGNKPILIICAKHRHIKILYKRISEEFGLAYRVEWVHHKSTNRAELQASFKNGEIDILVGSYILKRGKNFPLMRHLINAGGGLSSATVLQIMGRALRQHESKEYTGVDDFDDYGPHLKKHSKARLKVYKDDNQPITYR